MAQHTVLQRETEKATAYLRQCGVADEYLEKIQPKCRRVLARSLEAELSRLSASPGSRKATEADVMAEVKNSIIGASDLDKSFGCGRLRNELSSNGCETNAGREIVRGIRMSLAATVKPRKTK